MPQDITRNYGPSSSQSSTGEAIGHAEDYSKVLTNITPEVTLFLSKFGELPDATEIDWSWFTAGLRPPKKNARPEKFDYDFEKVGSIEGKKNFQQHFYNAGYVTDAQRKSKMIFDQDDFTREKMFAFTNQAKDIEYAIVKNTTSQGEQSDTDPAITGGIPFFMQVDNMACTVATTGIVTTTENHNLKTGDFVYLDADTMPATLSADCEYFVNALTDKTFQLYNTLEGAIETIAADKATPTSTGTNVKIVKNNVIDLKGDDDYTVEDLNRVMQMAYDRGGNPTDAFMSGRKKRRFSQLVTALASTQRKSGDKKMSLVATTYESDFGTIVANAHRMYSDNRIDILDLEYWNNKWFDRTHEVSDIAKKGTYKGFAIESWYGLEGTQPKASASIIGIKR